MRVFFSPLHSEQADMTVAAAGPLREKIRRAQPGAAAKFVAVDTSAQRLTLYDGEAEACSFTISTSRFGTGNRENSQQTPLGIHRIVQKIGSGAPAGRIFKDRCDTGVDWLPGATGDNLILTRILRLEGLEEGVNKGPGIDTFERYIYIHGTNREDKIGEPLSNGCVVMTSADIVKLFDQVEEGTLVVIY
jgi:UDP-N-acetylmuramate--alanine ligase